MNFSSDKLVRSHTQCKGYLNRETEALQIAAQHSAIKSNYVKVKINYMQQNRKCTLCRERDEMINYLVSKSSKLSQKEYKSRHDWAVKVIYWELCKRLIFDHITKWYMHKLESVQANETYETLGFWDINLILSRKPDLLLINKKKKKKNFSFSGFFCASRSQNENKRKWKDRWILGPWQRTKKNCETCKWQRYQL